MREVKLYKSMFYKDQPMEEIYFIVKSNDKEKYCLGASQEIYGRPRDEANVVNQLSVINSNAKAASDEFDATIYSSPKEVNQYIDEYLASKGYNIDEEKISKELEVFCDVSKRMEQAHQYSYLLSDVKNCGRRLKDEPEQVKKNTLDFIQEFIDEKRNPTGRTIKTPDARRKMVDRIFDKNSVDDYLVNLKYHIEALSGTKYLENASKLYEEGFPDIAKIEEQREIVVQERSKIYKEFDFDKRDKLKSDMMKQYEVNHIREAMQAKYYEETKDISIFLTPDDKKEFDKLDIASLVNKYGTDLVSTYKGATLVAHKLHEDKKQGKDIRVSLGLLKDLAKKAKSSSENPNNDMNVRYFLFNELKLDYQKFAKDDMEYRALISELAPSKWEQGVIGGLLKDKSIREAKASTVERANALYELQQKFTEESEEVISGKMSKKKLEEKKALIVGKKKEENIQSAIKRVKAKHEEARKTGENISGAIIASDIADRVAEGFEFPVDKEKQETVVKNLRKKRVANRENQAKAQQDKILKEQQSNGK